MWGEPQKSRCYDRALGWEGAEKRCRLVPGSAALWCEVHSLLLVWEEIMGISGLSTHSKWWS